MQKIEVEFLVFLSNRKSQHCACSDKVLTFGYIELIVEVRMYRMLRLYFDLTGEWKQVVIMDPFRQERGESPV